VDEILNYWVSFNETTTNVEAAEYQSRGQQINYYNYTDGNNGVSVNHYQIIGGGHIWFDLDINGQNTGELLWDFFDQYDINGKR
jgi:polyhydroxybutyrate depolymerase